MKALLAGSELCRNLGDEARSGGMVCRRFEDFDAVFESDTCDNLGQVICAFQPPPGFRCGDILDLARPIRENAVFWSD